jgi:V/A-type H+-transporting ATPase subunit A
MAGIAGKVYRVVGPVVEIEEVTQLRMLDMVEVGSQHLIGEVVHLKGDRAFVQVYEDTTSVKAGDLVFTEGSPLYVELAPGLLGNIYDGIQRPLEAIQGKQGFFIGRGVQVQALDHKKKWVFEPDVKAGDVLSPGMVIGRVQETQLITHRIMVPPDKRGRVSWIALPGEYTIDDKICVLQDDENPSEICMLQKWPVRRTRPYGEKLALDEPLLTGQRVIDTLFPIAKGGCVAVPGGFGTGKTVIQHQIAKWSDAKYRYLRGLRRARQRDDRRAAAFPETDRSQDAAPGVGAHYIYRQHVEYAGSRARSEHLYRHNPG